MTYKGFLNWCNDRVCDGCWGLREAKDCIRIAKAIHSQPFWRRKKFWNEINKDNQIERIYINPTNQRIQQILGKEV